MPVEPFLTRELRIKPRCGAFLTAGSANSASAINERIASVRPTSPRGALAKMEMGLRLQDDYEWAETRHALVLAGIEQLREMI